MRKSIWILGVVLLLAACSTTSEVVKYGPPYTVAKMQEACAADPSDTLAKAACVKLEAFAQNCMANIPAQAAAVNQGLALAGTVGTVAGHPEVGAATAGGAALNTAAIAPALTAAQADLCASGGFPMAQK